MTNYASAVDTTRPAAPSLNLSAVTLELAKPPPEVALAIKELSLTLALPPPPATQLVQLFNICPQLHRLLLAVLYTKKSNT